MVKQFILFTRGFCNLPLLLSLFRYSETLTSDNRQVRCPDLPVCNVRSSQIRYGPHTAQPFVSS